MSYNKKTFFLILLISFSVLSFGSKTFAAAPTDCASGNPDCYKLLAPLPFDAGTPAETTNPSDYVRGIVGLAIGAAGVIAVLQLIYGGFEYVTVENFQGKSDAKSRIKNAIIGLLLAIGAVTILQTINPKLVNLGIMVPPIIENSAITPQTICLEKDAKGNCLDQKTDPGEGDPVNPNALQQPCQNCAPVTSAYYKMKPPAAPGSTSGGCLGPGPCQIEGALAQQLVDLNDPMKKANLDWQVTEMYPPTVSHKDPCHSVGTCIDASLIGYTPTNPPAPQNIAHFINAVQDVKFLSFQWEEPSDTRRDYVKDNIDTYLHEHPGEFLRANNVPYKKGDSDLDAFIASIKVRVVSNPPKNQGGTLVGGAHMHINSPNKKN